MTAQPWLLESIDGNIAGVIFNQAEKFSGFDVRDVLCAWALTLALDASREEAVDRALALMCEAGQALNYAGFMDGYESGEVACRESGDAIAPHAFASAAARKAANARHAENRSMKAQVLAWYAAHGFQYASKDDAAIAATKIVAMKFSTVRSWLTNVDC